MFFRCIGISQIASYFMAGLILGPQLFDLLEKLSEKLSLDPALDGSAALRDVGVCGNIMLAFLMSVRISRRLAFNSGPLPIVIGILTFAVPLFGGFCFRNLYTDNIDPYYMPPKKVLAERIVIISSQSSILLPTVTYVLSELKILNSELGRLVLSSAMINDVLGIIVSILAYAAGTYKNVSHATAYRDIIAVIVFFLIVFFIFRPVVEWIVDRTPEGKPVANMYIHVVILSAFGSAAYSSFFNMKYLLGPFTVGLIIPGGPPLGSALEAKYYDLTMDVLLPIAIAFSTMRCDIMKIIYEFDDIRYNMFLTALTLALKLAAGIAPCLYCKLPLNEAFAISILLSCKSFSEIFLYESTLDDSLSSVNMSIFTAFTHENLMHDEICTLALDQTTSMIIIPSGRKWTIDGAFESDNEAIRRLNVSLLEHTPCSVGILVDRGNFSCKDTREYNIDVGVIFIGGKDDREALSLVKRMKINPMVTISVIRFVSNQETEQTNWECILDHEVLEDLKDIEATNCIGYTERIVTCGPEVATTIRSLSKDYDLMVVGRDHGTGIVDFSGLTEWIELSELGVIGDLLAARDLDSRVSVLVVKQQ
ncbi:unnamed protein product [Thlaspi arvense]|uniref:Cation/H+ exchanger domain-containing protein n=1 Tax=Thlaspi arvense TaxID=13288 RepID=A0AAU9SHY8_THLAR|nr:unnamed protein product [Thlaspi arvense]